MPSIMRDGDASIRLCARLDSLLEPDAFSSQPLTPGPAGTGQIIRLFADVATVQVGDHAVECVIRGKLFRTDPPAVGDFVRIESLKQAVAGVADSAKGHAHRSKGGREGNGAAENYAVAEILPRRSVLARRAAGTVNQKQVLIANIDQVVIVFSAGLPPFNAATLDRFLVVVEANDLQARIVINKVDQAVEGFGYRIDDLYESTGEGAGPAQQESEGRTLITAETWLGYPVHYTSAKTGAGMHELRESLAGTESAFVGPSGVGKSSLLNTLYPGLDLKVGQLSAAFGKGRHTTVGGYLIRLPDGASVADTAGLREVGLWPIPPDELPYCFPEFRPHLSLCRFSDCAHLAEPDCAVTTAVEDGEISELRYGSYVKLRAEAVDTYPRW